ncbi:hypothetical protein MHO82_19210 [Vibrio sp. Of7-15]|uniref:hypothetical protein n=1 Tax=Vibrio sp. Of7-15 TaxID=2724879 RepID=UPI001EF16496|nr:hypothetical protein [Vibrio sp. Of7-15]MCG7499000.1 hypothetical protein [Vibrio sp. Of7-15]
MKKTLACIAALSALSGCGSTAIMEKSEALKSQPELAIQTDGSFWGLGSEGTFTIAEQYTGKYSRSASDSTWFNTINIKDAEMVAEITRNDNSKSWQLTCRGGGTGVNVSGISFGGNDPYTCDVHDGEKTVGHYSIAPSTGAISINFATSEEGSLKVDDQYFTVKSVHKAEGSFMPINSALGYSFYSQGQAVAAAQTNGMLTLQMLPELTEAQKDTIVIGTIASALSWRPAD